MNVLVYSGAGVSPSSLANTLTSLRSLLSTAYDVRTVTAQQLALHPWPSTTALLVVPGGRDLPYVRDLASPSPACTRIRAYVESGGAYLGICAGAYFASRTVDFEAGTELEVKGERELGFFEGTCKGTVFPGFSYDSDSGARTAVVELEKSAWEGADWAGKEGPQEASSYYNGGGAFLFPSDSSATLNVQTLARFAELEDRPAAGVLCQVGRGRAALWAVHLEHPGLDQSISNLDMLRATLSLLGVRSPSSPEQRVIRKFAPILAISPVLGVVSGVRGRLEQTRTKDSPEGAFRDLHDTIRLRSNPEIEQIKKEYESRIFPKEADDLHKEVKDLVFCDEGIPPSTETPQFDSSTFYRALYDGSIPPPASQPLPFGSFILYTPSVTSTQTMLDKNPRFLSSLPTGAVFLASHQLTGRGRGVNNWVSPPGCLQFSLVARCPVSLAHRLVFVQYLFGLAVVEAIRSIPGYGGVGVRLKWPNDIYGDAGVKDVLDEKGLGRYKKLGGILVNSSSSGGDVSIIIGCGINVSTPSPTTSLNEIISLHNAKHSLSLSPLSSELVLALILRHFQAFWTEFERSRSFAPFENMYLDRWLHSGQDVTLEETKEDVRVVGLSPDLGYLRTVKRDSVTMRDWVDLEPDGNSFDMMKGLVKRKT